jgi:hypothetical protein
MVARARMDPADAADRDLRSNRDEHPIPAEIKKGRALQQVPGLLIFWGVPENYAVGCCAAFLALRLAAYFFSNLSTRPAVSISFWRPVKNGWHEEQISTRISPLCVDRVLKVWPQAQVTLISL